MREQPHALRLAKDLEMCAEIDFDHIFVPAAATLRTQHALLEQAKDVLTIADRSLCEMEHQFSGGDDEINLEPAILTVRAAIAAINQHLDKS